MKIKIIWKWDFFCLLKTLILFQPKQQNITYYVKWFENSDICKSDHSLYITQWTQSDLQNRYHRKVIEELCHRLKYWVMLKTYWYNYMKIYNYKIKYFLSLCMKKKFHYLSLKFTNRPICTQKNSLSEKFPCFLNKLKVKLLTFNI